MKTRTLEQDFEHYRRTADPEALGRVFDELAPRLLLLAGHLTRDHALAEDVLQSTFIQALRDASSWDGERPLVHWLAGVLAHRAADERRRARVRRASALAGTEPAALPEPIEALAEQEALERITEAIETLGEPYRRVLVLRAVHGLSPAEIAHALGRAPGTVRMQLQRARERLRQELPRELALPALLLSDEGRGLAALRAEVLRAGAPRLASRPGSLAGSPGATLGGWALAGLVLAGGVLIAGGLLWRGNVRTSSGSVADLSKTLAAGARTPKLTLPLEAPGRSPVVAPAPAAAVEPEAAGPASGAPPDVQGITVEGVVVDLRGNPVPGATLLGVDPGTVELRDGLAEADARGRFRLVDVPAGMLLAARARGFQPSSFSRKRGSVRVRAEPRLQEVVLRLGAQGQRLSGVVRDERGDPVPGAWLVIAVDEDARQQPEGLPQARRKPDRETSWLRCDAGGRFTSDEVPAGRVLLVARPPDPDRPGGPGGPAGDGLAWTLLDVRAGTPNRAELVLGSGAEIVGRVVDDVGRPLSGLQAVSEWKGNPELGELEDELGTLLVDRRTLSDGDGRFALSRLLPGKHELRLLSGERTLAALRLELASDESRAWEVELEGQKRVALDFVLLHRGRPERPEYAGGGRLDLTVLEADGTTVLEQRSWKPFRPSQPEPLVPWELWLSPGEYRLVVVDHTWVRVDGTPRPSAELRFRVPEVGSLETLRVEIR